MPSGKQRSSANAPDTSSMSLNERILKECHDLYAEEERGKSKFVHVGKKTRSRCRIKMFLFSLNQLLKINLRLKYYSIALVLCTGLISIAKGLGLTLLAPRKKINVILIGNHSAGKSSFINWYVKLIFET